MRLRCIPTNAVCPDTMLSTACCLHQAGPGPGDARAEGTARGETQGCMDCRCISCCAVRSGFFTRAEGAARGETQGCTERRCISHCTVCFVSTQEQKAQREVSYRDAWTVVPSDLVGRHTFPHLIRKAQCELQSAGAENDVLHCLLTACVVRDVLGVVLPAGRVRSCAAALQGYVPFSAFGDMP
jgi:hypothetical protein